MEISPRLIFNIDTLWLRKDIKRLFATKWLADLEKVEKGVRQNLALVIDRNATLEQPYDKEKVLHDMQIVLAQIKATKLKLQKTLPSTTYKTTRSNTSNSSTLASAQALRNQQEEELKTLAEEIRKQWQEAQQQYVYLTRIDENMKFSVQMPAVVYTSPKEHSYSYEFTAKPRIRIATPPPPAIPQTLVRSGKKSKGNRGDLYGGGNTKRSDFKLSLYTATTCKSKQNKKAYNCSYLMCSYLDVQTLIKKPVT
jgi:hypothetical protein